MTFITGPYDDLITTKTIDPMYTFRESNCEYLKLNPQNGAFAVKIKVGSSHENIWTHVSDSFRMELQLFLDLNNFLNMFALGASLSWCIFWHLLKFQEFIKIYRLCILNITLTYDTIHKQCNS